ncbi:hypothetical protein COX05_02050 [candidate division WWE3 bacterium CG22_combo_CG10-13_8_21_14_all_39_12]|uniref:Uncharacterized protein n=2 Tax=Katanobacteria TaxID=422282 RepID=A0A2M7X599_UNCKA|nr:MAG: hypothetical protein COX05_02050 [candidate division WWE3 bacterium CG22_combo_CG10-13_8_21_14_all_39_12]PJA41299.1 MAG: hypothetical protein CO179_00205 [candidate division WWE3 bacterium CG_4_9_14_3_um_filter_39_7]
MKNTTQLFIGIIVLLVILVIAVILYGLFFLDMKNPSPSVSPTTPSATPTPAGPSVETLMNAPLIRTFDETISDYRIQQPAIISTIITPGSTFLIRTSENQTKTVTITDTTRVLKPSPVENDSNGNPVIKLKPFSELSQHLENQDTIVIVYWEKDWTQTDVVPLVELISNKQITL